MFGPFQIIQLSPKKWFATFWAILWKIGQLFIRSPGHSDRIKLVMWLATPGRTGRNRRTRLVVVQKVFAVVAFWRNAGGRSKIFTQIRRPSFEKRRVYECDLAVRDVAEDCVFECNLRLKVGSNDVLGTKTFIMLVFEVSMELKNLTFCFELLVIVDCDLEWWKSLVWIDSKKHE